MKNIEYRIKGDVIIEDLDLNFYSHYGKIIYSKNTLPPYSFYDNSLLIHTEYNTKIHKKLSDYFNKHIKDVYLTLMIKNTGTFEECYITKILIRDEKEIIININFNKLKKVKKKK